MLALTLVRQFLQVIYLTGFKMAFLGDDSSTVSSDHGTSSKMFYTLIANLRRFYQRQNLQGTHKSGYPLARYRGHSMQA